MCVINLAGRKTGSFQSQTMLRKSCERWLIMTENIVPNCSSWNSVKKIDNEARKGNITYVFQELITMLRCCIHHKDLSLSLQDHESNIKISIRKYRFMSSWEEIKAWPKESRARMTFYNSTCKMPIFCWLWCNLWISQSCYDGNHDYWVGYIYIFKYETYVYMYF